MTRWMRAAGRTDGLRHEWRPGCDMEPKCVDVNTDRDRVEKFIRDELDQLDESGRPYGFQRSYGDYLRQIADAARWELETVWAIQEAERR